jgi:Ca2+-binding RTX toxin-like protein
VGEGNDRVQTSVNLALVAGSEIEILKTTNASGTTAINLSGNNLANHIQGNDGINTINGGSGVDFMEGRGGNDTYVVANLGDRAFDPVGKGTDTVIALVSFSMEVGSEIELLRTNNPAGTTVLRLAGNAFANTIQGNAGTNTLNGGAGNDTLDGMGGSDAFQFTTALNATTNVDAINGYVVADDQIRIDNAVFAGLAAGTLAADAFIIGAAAADAEDRIVYNSATGGLFFDADGVGGTAQVRFATLAAGLAMTNAEFFVI